MDQINVKHKHELVGMVYNAVISNPEISVNELPFFLSQSTLLVNDWISKNSIHTVSKKEISRGKSAFTQLSEDAVKDLKHRVYVLIMAHDSMGMGEMGEAQDGADSVIDEWMETYFVHYIQA
jgi:hypothetical protein